VHASELEKHYTGGKSYHNIFSYTNLKDVVKNLLKDKKLWKELICLFSVEGQPTKADLAQTCMGIFFIVSVYDALLANAYSYGKVCGPPVFRGPQFRNHWFKM
jgi:hypothetical protein